MAAEGNIQTQNAHLLCFKTEWQALAVNGASKAQYRHPRNLTGLVKTSNRDRGFFPSHAKMLIYTVKCEKKECLKFS